MKFNTASQKSIEQNIRDFSAPLGPMLAAQGVLTQSQIDKSGDVQAHMIAVRDAITNGMLTEDQAKTTIGEFKGAVDFGKLAKIDDAGRAGLLQSLNIGPEQLNAARNVVTQAEANLSNVNQGHSLFVPAMGFIHTDLHAKDIANFGQIKQAALLVQRAIDAANAIERIEAGTPDAAKGEARGFKLWGDESPMLADIIQTCKILNDHEAAGQPYDPDHKAHIIAAFDEASDIFESAGYPALANAIEGIRAHKTSAMGLISKGKNPITFKADDSKPEPESP